MTITRKTPHRLWCCGEGESWCWHVSVTRDDAAKALGGPVRSATPDDCRRLWLDLRLHTKTVKELESMFGVTRQAVDIWRAKGGDDLPRRCETMTDEVDERVLPLLDPSKTITELAAATGETTNTLRAVAVRYGVRFRNGTTKKPSDDEIVRLSEGRTWRELAAACDVQLPTLRNYVYANPSLSAQVRSRLARQTVGPASHGKVDPDEVRRLHAEGLTRYAIAQRLGVERMTVTHWLTKLGLLEGDR
jgi:plasmid maintenance system antidote protein VapI